MWDQIAIYRNVKFSHRDIYLSHLNRQRMLIDVSTKLNASTEISTVSPDILGTDSRTTSSWHLSRTVWVHWMKLKKFTNKSQSSYWKKPSYRRSYRVRLLWKLNLTEKSFFVKLSFQINLTWCYSRWA